MKTPQPQSSQHSATGAIRRCGTALLASLVLVAASLAHAESKAVARIITQAADPPNCISRVAVRTINGREKFVSPQGFNLEPGKYTLSGTVALDTRFCKVAPGNSHHSVPPLEAEFEAGKTYYLGFDHSSSNREDWAYVIWKVE